MNVSHSWSEIEGTSTICAYYLYIKKLAGESDTMFLTCFNNYIYNRSKFVIKTLCLKTFQRIGKKS